MTGSGDDSMSVSMSAGAPIDLQNRFGTWIATCPKCRQRIAIARGDRFYPHKVRPYGGGPWCQPPVAERVGFEPTGLSSACFQDLTAATGAEHRTLTGSQRP
jgi:hypothetical protein